MSLLPDCIFCKIIKGELPSQKVFENDQFLVFKDIYPQTDTHLLVIPKVHITSLADVTAEQMDVITNMHKVAFEVIDKNNLRQKGFRLVINTGKEGGQTVFHLHMHIMSGKTISARFG
jgi:histidine triad (HIT) family protein